MKVGSERKAASRQRVRRRLVSKSLVFISNSARGDPILSPESPFYNVNASKTTKSVIRFKENALFAAQNRHLGPPEWPEMPRDAPDAQNGYLLKGI